MKMNGELFVCVLPINNLLVFLCSSSESRYWDYYYYYYLFQLTEWTTFFFFIVFLYIARKSNKLKKQIYFKSKFYSYSYSLIFFCWSSKFEKKNVWIKSKNRNEVVNRIQRNRLSHWTFRCATRHIVYSVWCHWTHPFSQRVRIG